MARNQVKVIDRGWNRINKQMRSRQYTEGGGRAASVGIQGSEAELTTPEHGDMTNAELGAIQEFGTKDGRVPERSHIRSTFDKEQKKYEGELKKAVSSGLEGKKMEGELMALGEQLRADIINKIKSGIPPPLSEYTIARRAKGGGGGTTPLWASGQYVNAFSVAMVDPKDMKK